MTPAGDQGSVFDGISPYKVCPKDFSIAFPSSGVTARYLPPKPPPTTTLALDPGGAGFQKPPPDKPTTTAPAPVADNSTRNATAAPAVVVAPPPPPPPSPSLWFALMRARVVHDGFWLSNEPADAKVGVPLDFHDATSTYGGVFDVMFERHTLSQSITEAEGTYDASVLVKSALKIWKDWKANFVITADFDTITISKAHTIEGDSMPTPAPASGPSCADHPGCAALSLTGGCCPTADGTTLDCCS